MALSTLSPPSFTTHYAAKLHHLTPSHNNCFSTSTIPARTPPTLHKWRSSPVSFFTGFFTNNTKNAEAIKEELLEAIAPLDRGAEATLQDQQTINQIKRPKLLRSRTNYQAINVDILRAQNMESGPFFNQVTADLTPINAKKVAVKFDFFKLGGLIPVKAPERARGALEITYLDEELRVSRGDKGSLFILKMVDPSYRIPT